MQPSRPRAHTGETIGSGWPSSCVPPEFYEVTDQIEVSAFDGLALAGDGHECVGISSNGRIDLGDGIKDCLWIMHIVLGYWLRIVGYHSPCEPSREASASSCEPNSLTKWWDGILRLPGP